MPSKDIITVILTVFIAVVLVKELSSQLPEFGFYGWGLVAAFVAGAGWYFKNKYWKE